MHDQDVASAVVEEVASDKFECTNCGLCCVDLHETPATRHLVEGCEGNICPHLDGENKCKIYEERPYECRLDHTSGFDYTAWCKRLQKTYENQKETSVDCHFTTPEEIDLVGEMWKELMEEMGNTVVETQVLRFKYDLSTAIGTSATCAFIVYKNNEPVGFLTGGLIRSNFGTDLFAACEFLYVHPVHRDGEAFAALEQEASRWAVGAGALSIEIYVPLERRKVYQRKGYKPQYLRMKKELEA